MKAIVATIKKNFQPSTKTTKIQLLVLYVQTDNKKES